MAKTVANTYRQQTLAQNLTTYAALAVTGRVLFNNVAEAFTQRTTRVPAVLSNLYVRVTTNTINAVSTAKSRKNGADGNQIVSITALGTGVFEDTTHTDTVAAGDLINSKWVTGTSGSDTIVIGLYGCAVSPTSDTVTTLNSSNSAVLATPSTTYYSRPVGLSKVPTSETTEERFKVKTAGTVRNWCICITSNNYGTSTAGSRKNGANGNGAISITASTTGQFEDATHSDTIAVDDTTGVFVTTGTGGTTMSYNFYSDFITTDSTALLVASANAAGYATYLASTTYYVGTSGEANITNTTEAPVKAKVGFDCTASKGEVHVVTNTISATSTATLRKNGADTAIVVSIAASTTGWFEDASNTVSLVAADEINWKLVGGGSGTSVVITWFALKLVATAAIVYTLNVLTQPRCTLTGVANEATISVEILANAVRDTASTETLTVTKASGTGTLSGTTTGITPTLGVYTLSNVIMSGATGAVGNAPILTFASSVSGATVNSAAYIVREAVYATVGGYTGVYTYYDSVTGVETYYRIGVPATAVVGTPMPSLTYLHQAGFSAPDSASSSAAVLLLTSGTAFGAWVNSDIGTTFPYFAIFPVIQGYTDPDKAAYRRAVKAIQLRMVADGYNVNVGRRHLYGFSTGAIHTPDILVEDIWFWAGSYTTDGSITSAHLTGSGTGPLAYSLDGAFYDAAWSTPGGSPRHDLAVHTELARLFELSEQSLYMNRSNASSGLLPTYRDHFDMTDLFIPEMDAVGATVTQSSHASLIQVSPSTKRAYQVWPSTDHGATDAIIHHSSNRAALYAWLDHANQTRTLFSAPSVAPLSAPFHGGFFSGSL